MTYDGSICAAVATQAVATITVATYHPFSNLFVKLKITVQTRTDNMQLR